MKIEHILMASLDSEIEAYEKNAVNLPEPVFSKKHNNQIKKANKIANDTTWKFDEYHIIRFCKKRFAITVLTALIIMASTVIAIAIVHTEYYMTIKERLVELTLAFTMGNGNEEEEEYVIQRGVAPKGYTLSDEIIADGVYSAFYKSENNKEISYHQMKIDETSGAMFGEENESKQVEHIDGVKTIIIRKGECYILFWINSNCSYILIGNCELNILKEFIETIK